MNTNNNTDTMHETTTQLVDEYWRVWESGQSAYRGGEYTITLWPDGEYSTAYGNTIPEDEFNKHKPHPLTMRASWIDPSEFWQDEISIDDDGKCYWTDCDGSPMRDYEATHGEMLTDMVQFFRGIDHDDIYEIISNWIADGNYPLRG